MITKIISTKIYDPEALVEVINTLSGVCDIEIENKEGGLVHVVLSANDQNLDLASYASEFMTLLGQQTLNYRIRRRTESIRELIVRQAFAEAEIDSVCSA